MGDKSAALDAARTRAEEALRESDRHQGESTILRDSLVSREATVAQVLHSLGERDAQLAALRAEHGKMLPTLEAREKSTVQLESDLASARSQLAAVIAELKSAREGAAALRAQMQRHEAEAHSTRAELGEAKSRSSHFSRAAEHPAPGARVSIKTYFWNSMPASVRPIAALITAPNSRRKSPSRQRPSRSCTTRRPRMPARWPRNRVS